MQCIYIPNTNYGPSIRMTYRYLLRIRSFVLIPQYTTTRHPIVTSNSTVRGRPPGCLLHAYLYVPRSFLETRKEIEREKETGRNQISSVICAFLFRACLLSLCLVGERLLLPVWKRLCSPCMATTDLGTSLISQKDGGAGIEA